MLRSHLNDAFVLAHGSNHPLPFNDVVPVRLLNINVLASNAGKDRRDGMPVIRRSDNQRIDRLVIDQFAKVAFGAWLLALSLRDLFDSSRQPSGINIGDGDNLCVFVRGKGAVQRQSPAARSDNSDSDAFTGTRFSDLIPGEHSRSRGT